MFKIILLKRADVDAEIFIKISRGVAKSQSNTKHDGVKITLKTAIKY